MGCPRALCWRGFNTLKPAIANYFNEASFINTVGCDIVFNEDSLVEESASALRHYPGDVL